MCRAWGCQRYMAVKLTADCCSCRLQQVLLRQVLLSGINVVARTAAGVHAQAAAAQMGGRGRNKHDGDSSLTHG